MPVRALQARPGAQLVSIGPPAGVSEDDCGTVEALVEDTPDAVFPRTIRVPIQLEPGDLERLAAGEPLWLTVFLPRLVPFQVDLDPPSWHLRPRPEQV